MCLLALLSLSSAFGQKKGGTKSTEDSTKKMGLPIGVAPTDSTIIFCFKDLDPFFNAIQGKVTGRDGTILQLTTKEYFLLVEILNRTLEPVVQKWSSTKHF